MKNMHLFLYILGILLVNFGFKIENTESIVNGRLANPGEFKALVSIWTNGRHVCTGAMITKMHVLAAAHCAIGENNLFKNSEFLIRAGVNHYNNPDRVTATVDTIYIPREYERNAINPAIGYNNEKADICVFRLNTRLNTRQEVRKLKLPKLINGHYLTYNFQSTIGLGFGANTSSVRIGRDGENSENCGNYCGNLKVIQSNILSRNYCINQYELLEFKHICAKADTPDGNTGGTCFGDAGSPLIYDRDTIIGVLAQHTPGCNEWVRGSLYTRVSSYMYMISQAVSDKDNQLGDRVFDNVRVADWTCRNNVCSMIERA